MAPGSPPGSPLWHSQGQLPVRTRISDRLPSQVIHQLMARPFFRSWGAGGLLCCAIDAVLLGAQGRAFRVVTRSTRSRRPSTLQGASLAVKMLRRSASAESRYTASPLTGEPTACADSPITKSESESHPHTPLSCVRFRCLLGYHTRTPRVNKRNVRQLRAVC